MRCDHENDLATMNETSFNKKHFISGRRFCCHVEVQVELCECRLRTHFCLVFIKGSVKKKDKLGQT